MLAVDVHVVDHPLAMSRLTAMRDARTEPGAFRAALHELTTMLVYEATRDFPVEKSPVQTPVATAEGTRLAHPPLLVPVLRAGLGMLDSILQLVPHARVGFIGLKREETTLHAMFYHKSLPADLGQSEVILIDPMLATGGSAVAALDLLADLDARRVRLVNLVAAPEGIRRVRLHYPKLPIFTAAIDERLNGKGFIVPGLGDAGDRLFGV